MGLPGIEVYGDAFSKPRNDMQTCGRFPVLFSPAGLEFRHNLVPVWLDQV
jgi:hypothetical protein